MPKFLNKDFFFDKAEHFALAKETANVVLAPRFVLFSLPSSSNKVLSIFSCLSGSKFFSLAEILLLIFSTAVLTLFPKNLFWSLSLSSCASNAPVDAPEGEIAVEDIPLSK